MTTESRTLTLQEAAQMALDVQDASNLSGVAHSFLQVVGAVNAESYRLRKGTAWRNNHPIIRLFVDKMASLCGMQGTTGYDNFPDAYRQCKDYADGTWID